MSDVIANDFVGLSTEEASVRLKAKGFNELPGSRPRSLILIAFDVMVEPMFLLLLAASSIYMLLGESKEAVALAASILVVIAITILQERRTEHALARLRDLSDPQAVVLRDGERVRIPSREVVVGDVLFIREGDRIVADAILLSATSLSVDESILTGESLPLEKFVQRSGEGSADSLVFSGSLAVRGFGIARVIATGLKTEIGKIGRSLTLLKPETTPLFSEVRRIVRWVAVAGLLLCTVISIVYAVTRFDALGGVLVGITVAMSILPEEFPVVLTVFLAMGAWRLSRLNVLTRRMPAVETIGAATVLAVDKTGTLTENRMRVVAIETSANRNDLRQMGVILDESSRALLATAQAASERDAFDPMEHAIHDCAATNAVQELEKFAQMRLCREYDLTPELLAVTHVWQSQESLPYEVAVKGAPEAVFQLCQLSDAERTDWQQRVVRYADEGLRVLAVAKGEHCDDRFPDSPYAFSLVFLGLICLADPLRAGITSHLAECKQAGIRVVMITGDHIGTALAIAGQAGIDISAGAMTGDRLSRLPEQELIKETRYINVFARMAPAQKLVLVQALKASGEVVVMTGDGVNDAPALKAAHVGVAMGGRGTDVAREAASLVLVNDDFASLVGAVRMGRRIYQNIKHAMSFIIAVHIPIAGMVLLSTLLGWPLVLYPLHVMFLEFVIDPACSLAFEADPEASDLMRLPPRAVNASLFSKQVIYQSVLRGVAMLVYCGVVYGVALRSVSEPQARALAFIAMVVSSVTLIFVNRAQGGHAQSANIYKSIAVQNQYHWWIAGVAAMALWCTLYVPAAAQMFQFHAPSPLLISLVVSLGLIFLIRPIKLRLSRIRVE